MKKKSELLIIFNIIFYIFIFVHSVYIEDYLPQVLFYMSLAFSSIVLEEAFRNKIKRITVYSLIDFLLRMVVLIIHFIALIFNIKSLNVQLCTIIFLIFNILLEGIILNMVKNTNVEKGVIIKQSDIDKFIIDFKAGKINYFEIGLELKHEITNAIRVIEISGKRIIVIIMLFIVIFIFRFIYQHFLKMLFIPLIIGISLLYIIFKLSLNINKIGFSKEDSKKKNRIDIITFFIGYIILFVTETILFGKTGYLQVSIRVLAILFFIPMLNTNYILKKKLQDLYIKFNQQLK